MTRKTKSEKLAKSIRALRSSSASEYKNLDNNQVISVLSKEDAVKTFVTTFFILSTIALVFVLQVKGYVR